MKLDSGSVREEAEAMFEDAGVYGYFKSAYASSSSAKSGVGQPDLDLPWKNPTKEGAAGKLRERWEIKPGSLFYCHLLSLLSSRAAGTTLS